MKFIGITGGVGAGKSDILGYLESQYGAKILLTDEIAHDLMEPDTKCYDELIDVFIDYDVYEEDGHFNRPALAKLIFENDEIREALNNIVHPAVKNEVKRIADEEREKGECELLIVEAALLIEEHYDEICDELWYIFTSEEVRRERLRENRGYSDEKIDDIFKSQLSDEEYREHCAVVIDNNSTRENARKEIDSIMASRMKESTIGAEEEKMGVELKEGQFVFGLDIGTRNVVGTVGVMEDEQFRVVAQYAMEHSTRSMIDGQIHDIAKVAKTIKIVKENLEEQIGLPLTNVCIAAAGRVLKTVTTDIAYQFEAETIVTPEDIHTLDLLGIDKAQSILRGQNDTRYKFYCVGYSVVRYYLNDEIFSNLEGHKAEIIAEDIIVTFLPEDVVDGLYSACAQAGLSVANMTLEPIAAIDVAIPENFRMLNIALVDVGAGTSDISITRGGSIIAYGMIPLAGDEITELIVQEYLVDFNTAEMMKLASTDSETVHYEDIMGIVHEIPSQQIYDLTAELVNKITSDVADKIKELNGGKAVSATFVVGGGGKIHGFTDSLADKLGIARERVALRGEEVLKEIIFDDPSIKKDPLIVTPVGICLNYYDQKNNFIMVRFNGERVKLYDNGRLSIVDAAMAVGFPNELLFPRRGKEIHFTVNGNPRIARGEAGESAVVTMNGQQVSINTPLIPNSDIYIEGSTEGSKAVCTIADLAEYTDQTVNFIVNGKTIICPKFVEVNGSLEMSSYEVQEGDAVETRSYYTVEQLAEFMDVAIDPNFSILVNNRPGNENSLIYENFSVDWNADVVLHNDPVEEVYTEDYSESYNEDNFDDDSEEADDTLSDEHDEPKIAVKSITVFVNGDPVVLSGKEEYIFVDIFDVINFSLTPQAGKNLTTLINGEQAQFTRVLQEYDKIELIWEERAY